MPYTAPPDAPGSPKPFTPDELKAFAQRRHGARHWCARFAKELGLAPSTIWRMAVGEIPVNSLVMHAINGMIAVDESRKTAQRLMRRVGSR